MQGRITYTLTSQSVSSPWNNDHRQGAEQFFTLPLPSTGKPASRIQGTDKPRPFVGLAKDWQSHRAHSSDATASPT